MFRCVHPHSQTLSLSKMFKYKQADDGLVWNLKNQQPMLEDTWSPGPTFCEKESLGETIWHPVQSCLDHLQWWGVCRFLGRLFQWLIVLIITKPPKNPKLNQNKKPPPPNLSCIRMKCLLMQLVPVASCLLHVCPCEERASVLSVATL